MTSSRNPRSFTHGQACALPSPPKVGAVCLNGARTDLCGGRRVTCVPTAILSLHCSQSVCFVTHLTRGPAGRPTPALDPVAVVGHRPHLRRSNCPDSSHSRSDTQSLRVSG